MVVDYKEIGRNIKLCRMQTSLKQAALAELVGITPQHVSHIECGRTKLSLPILLQISEALSADLYTLLGNNIKLLPSNVADAKLTHLLKDASQAQHTLCLDLCGTVLKYEIVTKP